MPEWKHKETVILTTFVRYSEDGQPFETQQARTDIAVLCDDEVHRALARHLDAWHRLEEATRQEEETAAARLAQQTGYAAGSIGAEQPPAAASGNGAHAPGTAICSECELPFDRQVRLSLIGATEFSPGIVQMWRCQGCSQMAWDRGMEAIDTPSPSVEAAAAALPDRAPEE